MPFQDLKSNRTGGSRDPLTNRVAMQKSKAKHAPATISISCDLYNKIGAPGYVRLQSGTGEHEGMLLIRPAGIKSKTTIKVRSTSKNGQRFVSVSGNRLDMEGKGFRTTVCAHDLVDEGLVVTLPRV
jgi:hypothetical protein